MISQYIFNSSSQFIRKESSDTPPKKVIKKNVSSSNFRSIPNISNQKSPSLNTLNPFPSTTPHKDNPQTSNDFSFFLPDNENSMKSSSLIGNSLKKDQAVQTSFSSHGSNMTRNPRWIVSLCDNLINISKFYCMDSAQALQTYFYRGNMHLSSTEYNFFYGIFGLFFILTFFSGYFVEKNGVRFSLFLFCLMVFIGHFFFTLGGTYENYSMMLFGRLIFGIGSSCLELCQDLIITEWFFDREFALALGLSFASCRFGSALTIFFTPKIMIGGGFFEALSTGLVLSFIGVICSLIVVFIDRNFEEHKTNIEDVESFLRDFSFVENGITLEKLKEMGGIFWILILNALCAYACYFGFTTNSNDILCSIYGFTPQEAGELVTIMYFSAAFTPIFGLIIDRIGKRVRILLILLILLMVPFINFGVFGVDFSRRFIVLSLIFVGVFFSSYAAVLWSIFPLLVEGKRQCMAFAIIYSTLNISLVLSTIYIGFSIENPGTKEASQYNWGFSCMIICLIVSFCLILKINLQENKKLQALDSFLTNQEIRDKMNEDPQIGEKLLEMIEDAEKDNGIEENGKSIEMRNI